MANRILVKVVLSSLDFEENQVGIMSKKLNLVIGTLFALALFVVFHAVLAVTTLCSFVFLIPGMLFRWSTDEPKASQLR